MKLRGFPLWLASLVSLGLLGCPSQELAPLSPCTVSAASRQVDQQGLSKVDLLFVIDNSGSMATEQIKLANELPRLVRVLTTGDRNAGRAAGAPGGMAGQAQFTPVSSLHLGVVSSNMGGIDNPSTDTPSLASCKGLGDDGKLLRSTDVAVAGVTANAAFEFPGYRPGEVVLAPDPTCAGIADPLSYQTFEAGRDPSAEQVADTFRCVSKLGVRGCQYEQQLEAMWKAVAPSDGPRDFLDGTSGHGDPKGVNEGFVRSDAILAIIQVSDEEDCSIKQDGKALFSDSAEANQRFGTETNLRCGRHGEQQGLIWPVSRYIEGLRSLKPDNPDHIIFAAIVGIPERAIGMPFDQVLDLPEMQFRPGALGQPTPSCRRVAGSRAEEAYPPRRFLQVAQGFGNEAVVYSICANDYAPALDTLIDRIAVKLSGNCLPRRLRRDGTGKVQCDVYELLPKGRTRCEPARGHIGSPSARATSDAREPPRQACKMEQVPVQNGARGDQVGWYYDDFTEQVREVCPVGEQQRILFSFGELPEGASAIFECFQPITSTDENARGVDAVNLLCQVGSSSCAQRSDDDYKLACIRGVCQIACKADVECPPSWVCDTAQGAGDGAKYCQQPTCPISESSAQSGSPSEGDAVSSGATSSSMGQASRVSSRP